ncbi:hypothetical protein CRE_02249 [Caenorhabditis remanei]|uniref:Uncharacterized protein n=1 Tax=Caenorhabditis remanei TaxID=31234 RepID=E3LFW4_CAERE|nr:hypothetical protein CRE_02249 [Caenorhabditis remanei]
MRNLQQFFVAVLFLTFTALICAGETSHSISDILQTEQYIFLAQDGNNRFSEVNISHGNCPQVMNSAKLSSDSTHSKNVHIHLMRDPSGILPPKLLIIKERADYYTADVSSLNNLKSFKSKLSPTLENSDEESADLNKYKMKMFIRNPKEKPQSIFDTMSHVLYLFYPSAEGFDVTSYYIREVFTNEFAMLTLFNRKLNITQNRYGWVEDPYSNKVYYKEKVQNQVLLFEAPLHDLLHLLSGAKSGKHYATWGATQLQQVAPKETLMGASKSVLFGYENENDDGDSRILSSFITSPKSELTISCEMDAKVKNLPKKRTILIIRNNDYCMLRDRSKYNRIQCEKEQEDYMKLRTPTPIEPFNAVMWLMICCLILVSAIVLQCVYIYWLRSSFVTADDVAMLNENETEASLFIAKQRSFPTSYQDPALLDISVDKWN